MSQTIKASQADFVPLPPRQEPTPNDPFADLPENLRDEMRALLAPLQAIGAPLELDPVIPMTVGTMVEGRLFRVAVVSQGGIPSRVTILGPGLQEWSKDDFLALLPDNAAPPPAEPLRVSNHAPGPDQRQLLSLILDELRAIRAALGA